MAALMAVVLATFAVATRFRDYVPSVSTAALGDETTDRLLVGVLNFEGMGVNYATTIGYHAWRDDGSQAGARPTRHRALRQRPDRSRGDLPHRGRRLDAAQGGTGRHHGQCLGQLW